MRKSTFQKLILSAIFVLILLAGAVVLFMQVILPWLREFPALSRFLPNTKVVDFHTHFSLDPNVTQLVFDGQRLGRAGEIVPPLVLTQGGTTQVYLSWCLLREFVDPFVFWDEYAEVLFISTLEEMLEFQVDSEFFLLNGSPMPLESAIIEENGRVFVPASVVQGLYPLDIEYRAVYNIVVITSLDKTQFTANVSANRADVRYWPDSNSPITTRLEQGERLYLFIGDDGEDEAQHDFLRVRTDDGLLGYVLISDMEGMHSSVPLENMYRATILDDFIDNRTYHPRVWTGGAVNLAWENIGHPDANRLLMETPLPSNLTVISPTWFAIDESFSQLSSIASREYVDWAHEQGVLVWPLVFDVNFEHSRQFLTDRNARRTAINQIIEFVQVYNLDGINIDFEHLYASEGPYKIQFLRELAIPMRQMGVVLSAAVKAPIPATAFYQRDLIGMTVDFVMVMTYDQYWRTSPQAGPNASLPWVRNAVIDMLELVPSERLLMGIPFYNRVWREVISTGEVSSLREMGTNETRAFFEERNGEWDWDFALGVYHGMASVVEDGEDGGMVVVYEVWLEDARSLQEKMHLYSDYGLGGVAIWTRRLGIDEFWEVLNRYF